MLAYFQKSFSGIPKRRKMDFDDRHGDFRAFSVVLEGDLWPLRGVIAHGPDEDEFRALTPRSRKLLHPELLQGFQQLPQPHGLRHCRGWC